MLFVHDMYAVIGEHEFDFQDAVRDEYLTAIADDDTRLVWFLLSSHGSGDAYHVVMVTALRDAAAWERLSQRLRYGDLSEWYMKVSSMRYSAQSSLFVATDYSPLSELDLSTVPVSDVDHPIALYREDTLVGDGIHAALATTPRAPASADDVLTLAAAYRPALGSDTLVNNLYRVDIDAFTAAFGDDVESSDWAGSLTQNLPAGMRGHGRYMKSASWSPMG